MRRALRMQSVPAHTTFLLEISLHNNFFLAAILSVPTLKMQHTDSSHDLTHKWNVSCVNFQKLNGQVALAMASYKTSPKVFGNSGEHCNNAVKDTSHQKNLRRFGGGRLDQWMRQWTEVFGEETKLIAKESQKLAEEWILADLENERCWKPYSHQHGGACCHRSQILSCEQFAKLLAYPPQSLQDGMVNQINYPTHRISVAKIPPKKIQSGGTKLAQFLQHNPPQVPVAIAPGVENCCCDSASFKDLSASSFSNTGKSWKQERWECVLNGCNEPPKSVKREGRVTCS